MTQLLPPKKDVALALLERSNVDIHLDPRAKGVVVPPQFRKEPRLILKIGLNMPVAIPDLRLDDDSMSCTLSFSRTPFYCVVPWPSVFAIVGEDGRGMVWPDDVPQELAVRLVDESKKPGAPEAVPSPSAGGAAGAAAGPRGRGKRVVAAVEDAPAERPAKGRKSKKKKDEARPVLVAVPPPAPSEPRPEPSRAEARPEPARVRDGVSPVPRAPAGRPGSQRPSAPANRPKRELPPYLRVVK